MTLNSTPMAERVHIGIFGRRNAGKSSLINAITGQNLAIVSDTPGTTTDPVTKSMELLPLGPVVMIDTPGLDDEGELGTLRIQKTYQILNKTDIAILVIDASLGLTSEDKEILKRIQQKKIPYIIVRNKIDQCTAPPIFNEQDYTNSTIPDPSDWIDVSARTGENISKLKERIAAQMPTTSSSNRIVGDLLSPNDLVVLVVPIDSSAPKGRLILPQQQTIRDILESGAQALVTRDTELENTLSLLKDKPKMVITDSQVFQQVSEIVPKEIPLTSFSILMARYKGNLTCNVNGARKICELKDGDTVLISEGCTHHRQCEDIGTVKIPQWLEKFTGAKLNYIFTSGTEFPTDLSPYTLIIHCGGCTLNEREMKYRLKCAEDAGIPMTNYGTAIAYMNGILEKSVEICQKL